MAERVEFDLARMTPEALSVWLSVYELGYRDGINAGRQQVEDEWHGRMAVSAAIARQIAEAGPLDELEELRGRPARAAAHRRLMVERGVMSA